MARDVSLLKYLPQILLDVEEYQAIDGAAVESFEGAFEDIEKLLDDQFLISATERVIARWESILKIKPKASNSLDDRRFRILSRLNSKLPYTFEGLKEQLDNLCGKNKYTLDLLLGDYKLVARVALEAKEQYLEVEDILHRQVPANMLIDLELLFNTHETLADFTHGELVHYTHRQLREEILVKEAST